MAIGCGVDKVESLIDVAGRLEGAETALEAVELPVEIFVLCSMLPDGVVVLGTELDSLGGLSSLKSIGCGVLLDSSLTLNVDGGRMLLEGFSFLLSLAEVDEIGEEQFIVRCVSKLTTLLLITWSSVSFESIDDSELARCTGSGMIDC